MIEFGICLKEMKKLLYLSRCINAGGPGVATTAARAANTLPDYPPLTEQILQYLPLLFPQKLQGKINMWHCVMSALSSDTICSDFYCSNRLV